MARSKALLTFGVLAPIFVVSCSSSPSTGSGGAGGNPASTSATTGVAQGSTTSVTSAASTASSTSASGSTSAMSSTGAGPMCTDNDPGEPNDTMATAFVLPPITDCDSDGTTVNGMLGQGGHDVDWYRYDGSDTSFCQVNPTRQLTGPGIRICKYAACPAAQFTCPSGTQFDTQIGKPGCCWTGTAPETLDLNCNGTDDSATIYIRVDHPGGPGCESYSVDYHF